MRPRCVIDTNVIVGACLGTGAPSQAIAACLSGEVMPLMGTALLSEYEEVMAPSDLFSRCRLSALERDELLDNFLADCDWTRFYFCWRPNLPDEADNHLIELAVTGRAGPASSSPATCVTWGAPSWPFPAYAASPLRPS